MLTLIHSPGLTFIEGRLYTAYFGHRAQDMILLMRISGILSFYYTLLSSPPLWIHQFLKSIPKKKLITCVLRLRRILRWCLPNLRLKITCNSKTVHHETHSETDDLKHGVHVRSWNTLWYIFYRWRYGFSWRTKHSIHSILFWPLSWSWHYRLRWNVPNKTPSRISFHHYLRM